MIIVKAIKWFSYATTAFILAMIALSLYANAHPLATTVTFH